MKYKEDIMSKKNELEKSSNIYFEDGIWYFSIAKGYNTWKSLR